ncbi:hypothetical protein [Mycolicibacterium xanthum]|uniref:hypothetical protein n=1 Tax=Mycolicibacterium xanthum TaxID=2796469 RepID=UPI0021024C72|nr:hypothetical protein [Mycolicibacterium xanthum]
MSTTLVELDNHPGLQHVRRYPPQGATARRWAEVEPALTALWEDLGRMTTILESARTLRSGDSRLDDDERAELTRLLREPSLEVSRHRVPFAQRNLTGPGETVVYVGLADTADRMRAAYPAVAEFLDHVDAVNALIATGLAPAQQKLDDAGVSGPEEIAELLAVSATDPLSLSTAEVEERIRAITADIDRRSAELAELAALRENWGTALAEAESELDALDAAVVAAAQIRAEAEQKVITGPFPVHADATAGLRAELTALTVEDPVALRSLRGRIGAALRVAHEDRELAQGLLDRRAELKGRLTAYQAKAARLGLSEDRDLMASGGIASGLLARRPCDLRAATRAVADYQQMIAELQERTTG